MADVLTGVRQKLQQISESGRAIGRLAGSGIIDLKDLRSTARAAKLAPVYGPQATMAIMGGSRYAALPAIVDERGTLTYKQVDDQSWALAHGLKGLGSRRLRRRCAVPRPSRPCRRDGRMRQARRPDGADEHRFCEAAVRGGL